MNVVWDFIKSLSKVQLHYVHCVPFIKPTFYFSEEGDQFDLAWFFSGLWKLLSGCSPGGVGEDIAERPSYTHRLESMLLYSVTMMLKHPGKYSRELHVCPWPEVFQIGVELGALQMYICPRPLLCSLSKNSKGYSVLTSWGCSNRGGTGQVKGLSG